ncbi:MAG: ABC transporter transmembrane domain-containing protein, partial [Cellulosilyticaceae bacterium]
MVVSPKILGNATTSIATGISLKLKGVPNGGIDFQLIFKLLVLLTISYLLNAFFAYLQQYLMSDIAQKTVFELRSQVDAKLSTLPLSYFDSRSTGDLLSIVTNDVDNISNTLQQSLTQFITSIITIIGVIAMMLTISPLLTLIILITLPLGVLVIRPIVGRSQKFFSGQQEYLGKLNGHIEEMYTGHRVVKAFGHEPTSIKEFSEINDVLFEYGWKAQFLSGLIMPLMMFVNNIGYVVITVVGSILVIKGRMNIGDIQAFIQYSRQFTQPINQLANIANILQSTVASAERVFELIDATEELPDDVNCTIIENPQGNVGFHHVKFGYNPEHLLMKDITFNVNKGETIAIVGPTGAGKTTMINLLMRF